jgi:hypothetical protein
VRFQHLTETAAELGWPEAGGCVPVIQRCFKLTVTESLTRRFTATYSRCVLAFPARERCADPHMVTNAKKILNPHENHRRCLDVIARLGWYGASRCQEYAGDEREHSRDYVYWLPSIRTLGELHVGTVTYRATLRAHLLAEKIEEKEAVEKTLERVLENNLKIRKTYEAMISSPEERALYDDWSKRRQDYKDIAAKIMLLSRNEAGRLPREALELNKHAVELGNESDAVLKKAIELNNKGAEAARRLQPTRMLRHLLRLLSFSGLA